MCKLLITFMLTEAPRLRSAAAVAVFPRAAARWSGVLPETSIWSTSSPSRVISSHSHPEIPSCNVGSTVSTLKLLPRIHGVSHHFVAKLTCHQSS